jgi:adenosine deaminase
MPTIELYGAGGLEMTPQLTNALERYAKYCYKLNEAWKLRGTNINNNQDKHQSEKIKNQEDNNNCTSSKQEESENTDDPAIMSIPVYYKKEEPEPEKDPFYSFSKIIINNDQNEFNFDNFNKLLDTVKEVDNTIKDISESLNSCNIRILNIQSGSINFWDQELEKLFKENNTKFYLFYWFNNGHNGEEKDNISLSELKEKYEVHDKIWGYSRFMREFLKARNRRMEMEFEELKKLSENKIDFETLIKSKIKDISDKNPVSKKAIIEKIDNILKYYNLSYVKPNSKSKPESESFSIKDLSILYLYNRNNHFQYDYFEKHFPAFIKTATGSGHQLLNTKDDLLLDLDQIKELGALEGKLFFYDFFKNVTDSCIYYRELDNNRSPDFLFLDDLFPEKLEENDRYLKKYARINDWFPNSSFYYSDNKNILIGLFESDHSNEKVGKFYFKNGNQGNEKISIKEDTAIKNLNKEKTEKPLFIGIDIDWNGELYGFELLQQYRKHVHKMKRPCFIFVFSRYEYPSTIRKAVSSGALFYITKQNYMNLVHKVHSILREMYKNPEEIIDPKYRTYENWHLLNKLEPSKVVQLKSEVIKGISHKKLDIIPLKEQKRSWKWINKLPKAELHCHIGSCLGSDLLPLTAMFVLAEKLDRRIIKKENIEDIIKFVSLFAYKLEFSKENTRVELQKEDLIEILKLKNTPTKQCLFQQLIQDYKLTENIKFPEEVLLSPKCTIIDRLSNESGEENDNTEYFTLRKKLRDDKIYYDDIMLFFILFIYVKEKGIDSAGKFIKTIKKDFSDITDDVNSKKSSKNLKNSLEILFGKNESCGIYQKIKEFINILSDKVEGLKKWPKPKNTNGKNPNLLEHLQSTREQANSLFTYLRGCEYGGSPHLQTKASISLACYYIVNRYAIPDNIRYLTLRCAVDGYAKSGILSQDEAIQALLKGFDKAVENAKEKKKENVHVDLILTAKRHKGLDQFEKNVRLALQYRNGLNLPKGFKEESKDSFFKSKTKVVSFDLAGLEKGNRVSKYLPQFKPLLKSCFPITIHAGEEDSSEAIWEAIYLIQAQRLGHALTLHEDSYLLELVRDRHIAIELCPISNMLTRNEENKYEELPADDRNESKEYKKPIYYPLRNYLMENIDVTINTDNPFVSGSNLTDEYLVAAKYAGGLSKWEILRLIKNSFRSAAIPKKQKKLLMNEIDDEIYNLLLEE